MQRMAATRPRHLHLWDLKKHASGVLVPATGKAVRVWSTILMHEKSVTRRHCTGTVITVIEALLIQVKRAASRTSNCLVS